VFPLGFKERPVQQSSNTAETSKWRKTKRERAQKRVNEEKIQEKSMKKKSEENGDCMTAPPLGIRANPKRESRCH